MTHLPLVFISLTFLLNSFASVTHARLQRRRSVVCRWSILLRKSVTHVPDEAKQHSTRRTNLPASLRRSASKSSVQHAVDLQLVDTLHLPSGLWMSFVYYGKEISINCGRGRFTLEF